ncbi:hypothetical protein SAMN05445504_9211 [Burkholderia sp. CF099]|nr:hypothetical protein SAMN05445504_9211 [Burkholderia sp. CF099]
MKFIFGRQSRPREIEQGYRQRPPRLRAGISMVVARASRASKRTVEYADPLPKSEVEAFPDPFIGFTNETEGFYFAYVATGVAVTAIAALILFALF